LAGEAGILPGDTQEDAMHFVLIGDDGTDAAAPARRQVVRPRHLAHIRAWAEAGKLILSGPRMPDDATTTGSLQFFDVADAGEMDAYMAAEPFAMEGVWQQVRVLPFRVAPLPYRPLPGTPGGSPDAVFCWVVIAWDGSDADAEARRMAARPAHMTRVAPLAAEGRVLMGGAILDAPEGRMIGSIMAVSAPDEAATRAFIAEDPYMTQGVWRETSLERWRIGPQPYKKLPGQA
jgi:uncharacterized protein YciI